MRRPAYKQHVRAHKTFVLHYLYLHSNATKHEYLSCSITRFSNLGSDEQFRLKTKAKKSRICKIQWSHIPMELSPVCCSERTGRTADQHWSYRWLEDLPQRSVLIVWRAKALLWCHSWQPSRVALWPPHWSVKHKFRYFALFNCTLTWKPLPDSEWMLILKLFQRFKLILILTAQTIPSRGPQYVSR